jgi:hypothetical protein
MDRITEDTQTGCRNIEGCKQVYLRAGGQRNCTSCGSLLSHTRLAALSCWTLQKHIQYDIDYHQTTFALFIRLIIYTFQLVFLIGIVFFSHNKSANSVFQSAYQPNRDGLQKHIQHNIDYHHTTFILQHPLLTLQTTRTGDRESLQ